VKEGAWKCLNHTEALSRRPASVVYRGERTLWGLGICFGGRILLRFCTVHPPVYIGVCLDEIIGRLPSFRDDTQHARRYTLCSLEQPLIMNTSLDKRTNPPKVPQTPRHKCAYQLIRAPKDSSVLDSLENHHRTCSPGWSKRLVGPEALHEPRV
jgi:hypothetical protein